MFVPFFPLGTIRGVLSCPTCMRLYRYALKGRKLKAAIAKRRETALGRVGEDLKTTLEDVAQMAHLGDFEGVESLLQELANGEGAACALARARFLELQRRTEEAEACLREAVKTDVSSGAPQFWLGRFLLNQGRDAEAVRELRQAAELSHEYRYLDVLESLIKLRKRQKQWGGLAAIMAEILRLEPGRANTGSFSKLFTKACRKSGRVVDAQNPYAQS